MERGGLVDRTVNLDRYLDTMQIIVISGVRRCGKSSLLSLIRNRLSLEEREFCYFNFDDERISPDISLFNDLYAIHIELYQTEPVFFFDEVQVIPGWEKFVNRMYEQQHKVYVTGSNARLLSSEIATTLTGRTKVLELFPFSFAEYLRFLNRHYDLDKLSVRQLSLLKADLNTYLIQGGFPLVLKEQDMELLNGWFQDILYRDIVARYRLSSAVEIKQIAIYLLTNIGKPFSYATLQNISGIKSSSSVKDYLHYYESCFLFYYLRKFDYSVKKQIMNSRKVYAIDNGVANRLGVNFSKNTGRLMENAVFVELLRRNKEVFYFSGKNECDFLIVENLKAMQAIQVIYQLNEENQKRELAGISEAMKTYHIPDGLIITFEKSTVAPGNGIKVITLYDWLLDDATIQ